MEKSSQRAGLAQFMKMVDFYGMETVSNLDFDTNALDQFYKIIEKVISRNNSTGLKTGHYRLYL